MNRIHTLMKRCAWAHDELSVVYHDREWGVPVHDDRTLFEFLILEGAQAGLSWITILRKRENYRRAFDGFDARKIARHDARKVKRLLADPGIVRNRLKGWLSGRSRSKFFRLFWRTPRRRIADRADDFNMRVAH